MRRSSWPVASRRNAPRALLSHDLRRGVAGWWGISDQLGGFGPCMKTRKHPSQRNIMIILRSWPEPAPTKAGRGFSAAHLVELQEELEELELGSGFSAGLHFYSHCFEGGCHE